MACRALVGKLVPVSKTSLVCTYAKRANSHPPPIGPQGITPTPKCLSIGIISRSSSRYMSECWFCIEMNGVRRLFSAYSTDQPNIAHSHGVILAAFRLKRKEGNRGG